MSGLRRFVAGAICPACGAEDKLYIEESAALRIRACVACGYRDAMNRSSPTTSAEEAPQPVRLIDH